MAVLGLRFCARAFPSCGKRGHSSSRCAGLSLSRPLLLRRTGSRRAGSAIVAHGPSCSAARGILPDQGSNPCPLHWQADSQPLRHQGSPDSLFLYVTTQALIQLGKLKIIYKLTHKLIQNSLISMFQFLLITLVFNRYIYCSK